MAQWLRVIATKPEDPVQFTGPTHKVKKKNQLSEVILTATPLPCHMCMCMCVCAHNFISSSKGYLGVTRWRSR